MNKLFFFDFETYSPVDLGDCGAYNYVTHPKFKVVSMAYAVNDEPVQAFTPSHDEIRELILSYYSKGYTFVAHNVNFERLVLSVLYDAVDESLPDLNWVDTMVLAQYAALPAGLDDLCKCLDIKGKLNEGKSIIKAVQTGKAYSKDELLAYNLQDVEITRKVYNVLWDDLGYNYSVEKDIIDVDKRINDYGIMCDTLLCHNMIQVVNDYSEAYAREVKNKYGGVSFGSPAQVKKLLKDKFGVDVPHLRKDQMEQLVATIGSPQALEVLNTYSQKISSQSKKYNAFINYSCGDDRCRGMFLYYGASRTGRWSSRGVQLQNILRTVSSADNIAEVRQTLLNEPETFIEKYGNKVPTYVGDLIRTALIPSEGYKFYVVDFNAIEARVLAWLAGETWRNELFKSGGKLYETTASKMLGKPISECGKGTDARYIGKCAELAFGYGGAEGAWRRIVKDNKYSSQSILNFVKAWRQSSPAIVGFWKKLEDAWSYVARNGGSGSVGRGVRFGKQNNYIYIQLPSGRRLFYYAGGVSDNLYYYGVNNLTHKFEKVNTYGGSLAENITQAVSRDLLANGVLNVMENYRVVGHVHDEIIVEIDEADDIDTINKDFTTLPEWAEGLACSAEGFTSEYYIKG